MASPARAGHAFEHLTKDGHPEDGVIVRTLEGLTFQVRNFFDPDEALVYDLYSNCCGTPLHSVPPTAQWHYCSSCYEDTAYSSRVASFGYSEEIPSLLIEWLGHHRDPLTAVLRGHELAEAIEALEQEVSSRQVRAGSFRLHALSWEGFRQLCAAHSTWAPVDSYPATV